MLGNDAGDDNVIVRGLGPSLSAAGVSTVLANPTLELRNSDGTLLISNNDWQDNASAGGGDQRRRVWRRATPSRRP